MLSQIGQKKKKEAVRRLSQSAARKKAQEDRITKRSRIAKTSPESSELSWVDKPSNNIINKSVFWELKDTPAADNPGPTVTGSNSETATNDQKQSTDLSGFSTQTSKSSSSTCVEKKPSYLYRLTPQNIATSVLPGQATSGFGSQAFLGFPVSQETSGFHVSTGQMAAGFPVLSSPLTSGLPAQSRQSTVFPMSTNSMTAGFPLSNIQVTSALPVSASQTTSKFSVPNKEVGFGLPILTKENSSMNVISEGKGSGVGLKKSPSKLSNITSSQLKSIPESTESGNSQISSLPDISTLKSLVIRDIPPDCNKNTWLKRFYSRFGEVVKVLCNVNKASATVTFTTHEAAKLAKLKGKVLQKGMKPVNVFWKQERKRTSSSSQDTQEQMKSHPINQVFKNKPKETVSLVEIDSLPVAKTTGEKFKVLEMIDAKLREGLTKAGDISTAKAVKGTCPDMCPEKERYMREDRRRLHVFEMIPGTGSMEENPLVDHTKAVKEYDRSAADKEEPLPHELRPIPALRMTMDYLVTNIMDIGESRWADWFDFLWNRTRAIRKDITQQHLCDPESVDLIEKTARFHIFCSHYLSDQDFGVFDPKINTENLTKCLQTLKHFYDDLNEQNITCPNEDEFRAYDILLNINEGDILRQVMTYREVIRTSPAVRFAMEVFNAVNSNNSVRFFKLVRSSTYLCACVLHRYFTQVRQQAIRILNYSLSVPNKEFPYPLNELTNVLAFENDAEAGFFCQFHGMAVTEAHVVFMRGSFIEPENTFPASKSMALIESKRACLIGEVVYNGPLPENPHHQPSTSFDMNGHYIGDIHILPTSPDTKTQSPIPPSLFTGEQYAVPMQKTMTQQPSEPDNAVQINIEELKDVTKTMFLEVISEMSMDIARNVYDEVQVMMQVSNEISNDIQDECVLEQLQQIAESTIIDEQQQQMMQAARKALMERVSSVIIDDIINEVVVEETHKTASLAYGIEYQRVLKQCKEIITEQISQNILNETVLEEIQKTAKDAFREVKAQRKSLLDNITHCFILRQKRRYFKKWVKSYHSLVRLKKLLHSFPAHPPFTSSEEQLKQLVGVQYEQSPLLSHSIRILQEEQSVAETLIQRQREIEQIRSIASQPINIPEVIATQCSIHSTSQFDWKLVISFPVFDDDDFVADKDTIFVNSSLLRNKFKKGTVTDSSIHRKMELLSLYRSAIPSGFAVSKQYHICTLGCYGVLTNNEVTEHTSSRCLQGTSSMLIVVDSSELQSNIQALRTRVQRLFQCKPDLPAIPVVILLLEDQSTNKQITEEELLNAIRHNDQHADQISEISIARIPVLTDIQTLNNMVEEIVAWLAQHSYNKLKLASDSLKNFVEEGVQRYFFTTLYEDVANRKKAGLSEQCPEAVIGLYNAVIEHLASVASSHNLRRVSWPAKEFCKPDNNDLPVVDWNSDASLSSLSSIILSLCLPHPPDCAQDGTWNSEVKLCHQYIKQLHYNSVYLSQRVNWLVHHRCRSLQANNLCADEVPWTQVIDACVSTGLSSLHLDLRLSQTEVFYFEDELDSFNQPEIWRTAALSSKEETILELEKTRMEQSLSSQSKDALIYRSVEMIDRDLDIILNNKKTRLIQKKKKESVLNDNIEEIKGKLSMTLQEARSDIASFEGNLQNWLPECYMEITKKRKADTYPEYKNPAIKSSRSSPIIQPPHDDLF